MKKAFFMLILLAVAFSGTFMSAEQNVIIMGGQPQQQQQQSYSSGGDPITASAIAAATHVNKMMWWGAGCLFGILGVGAAYLIEPSPPATMLMGKDANYAAIFTENYKNTGKSIQTKYALYGCLVEGLLISLYYLFVIILFAEVADDLYYY
ncbi:hypothetical protein KAI78_09305 [bacterium]|nr:hypothetical protein [bacterium]